MSAPTVAELAALGVLSPLDLHFARAMARLAGDPHPLVELAAAAASRATAAGHVCADLRALAGERVGGAVAEEPPDPGDETTPAPPPRWPALDGWLAVLQRSPLIGDGGDPVTPLVLDDAGRLYLTRYWRYERELAAALIERAGRPAPALDAGLLDDGLARLFPRDPSLAPDEPDRQREAARAALTGSLAVISGGPGTGKTATVVRILALLLEQATAAGRPSAGRPDPRVVLAAPTGKAAARMTESIRHACAAVGDRALDVPPALAARIPDDAATIHRTLGARWDRPTRFRHDADEPLVADVVVVDEASMVDAALMAKLVRAVPPAARLVLLGDRDQLASVEAGAVLGDLCEAEALGDAVVQLTRSYRFGPDSGIGRLAAAIQAGDDATVMALLRGGGPDLCWHAPDDDAALRSLLDDALRDGYAPYLDAVGAHDQLRALEGFRVLCAHRRGAGGVERLNQHAERSLRRAGRLRPDGRWYPGRPLLVTANDLHLRLFNGDVGLITARPGGAVEAVFAGPDGTVRALAPSRLPPHETVFATTVHKSQGSEFDRVVVVLPTRPSPVTTRELLYTAVTRARRHVTVIGPAAVIAHAVHTRVQRASGLRDRLRATLP